MAKSLARQAGAALIWKTIQLAGIKVIYLIRTVVLARLLVPEDFGLVALTMIGVNFLMSITNFGMTPALVQNPQVDENHYDAAWTINVTRAIAISTIVFLAAPLIATLMQEPRVVDLIRVATLRPILDAVASIKLAELIRNLEFRSLTINRLADAVANAVFSILLAPVIGVWALVLGTLIGQAAYVMTSYLLAPYTPRLHFKMETARPLIGFGQWIFLTQIISVTASASLQIIISRQLGAAELGTYVLAAKLAFLPYELSTEVMSTVVFPMFARLQTDLERTAHAFRTVLTGMLILMLPVCILLIILAPALVEHLLGPNWEGTVPIIRVFALSTIVGLLGDIIVQVMNGLGMPRKETVIEWIQSAIILASIWILVDRFGAVGAALATLIAVCVSQFLGTYFLYRTLPTPFAGLAPTLVAISLSLGVLVALSLITLEAVAGIPGIVATTIVSLAAMAIVLWTLDQRWHLGLIDNLSRTFPQMNFILRRFMVVKASSK